MKVFFGSLFFPFRLLFVALVLSSCAKVKVEPIEVKPIEINVNVRVKVEKELDDFFGDLDAKEQAIVN
ncbi:MAG: YnbE family lipoprotein [Verrucomicrobiales bacterium]